MFKNRQTAGQQLTFRLLKFDEDDNAIVVGLPRGGVIVAAEVARNLGLPLEIIIVKKIGAPLNPEFAVGALAETGARFLDEDVIREHGIPSRYIDDEIKIRKTELEERIRHYRNGKPMSDFKGKTAILIDDGIATGATVRAAIFAARKLHARKIVVGTPVISTEALETIREEADLVVYLEIMRAYSFSVGEYYESFPQVDDEAVLRAMGDVRVGKANRLAQSKAII